MVPRIQKKNNQEDEELQFYSQIYNNAVQNLQEKCGLLLNKLVMIPLEYGKEVQV